VDDELDSLGGGNADFQEACGVIGTDEHGQVVEVEYLDRVALRVEHVLVVDTVFTQHVAVSGPSLVTASGQFLFSADIGLSSRRLANERGG
jgi:hypothetical protein